MTIIKRKGVTLVELMVALAVLTIGVVGLAGSFSFIQKAIQASKNRTLASNLAQEKMQILKQKVYYQVLITSDPAHNTTDFAPQSIDYDPGYFPPENVTEAGVTYTRYTYVQVAREDSGGMVLLAPNIPDTGMKLITVTVVWSQGGTKKKITLRNMMSNPDTVMSNSIFNGQVRDSSTLSPINGALVSTVENAGWRDTANISGQYNINASPGNYTMVASAKNYFTQTRAVSISANQTQSQTFDLVKMATGTITGYAWLADHLVISQIVGSSISVAGYDQEYVEIYNPTTYTWTVDGNIGLKFQRAVDTAKHTIQLSYIIDEIQPGGFYLFANTTTISAVGMEIDADAVWDDGNTVFDFPHFASQHNIIPVAEDGGGEGCGAVELYRVSDGKIIDQVGWDRSNESKTAPFYEADGYNQGIGLQRNEFFCRKPSPAGADSSYGPAYDSNNNNVDIYGLQPAFNAPNNTDSAAKPAIAATPAAGAVVTCSDGLSGSAVAALTGNPPSAFFTLVDVATGAWTTLISSGIYSLQVDSVTIAAAGDVYLFPSSTTFLSQEISEGLITGRVLNAYSLPISPAIVVTPGAMGSPTGASTSNGRYTLRVMPGLVDVTANPVSAGNALYVTQSSNTIPIAAGEVHSGVDFILYQGSRVSGFITRDGINPLPGVAVAIVDSNGIARDQQVSGLDGRFTSVNVSTGLYFVRPSVGSHELVSPDSVMETLDTPGLTVFSDTFTVSGAMGYVTGAVRSGGLPIKTGVLIVVTAANLTGTPPAPPDLSAATLADTPYYLVSSMEDGTYTAEVRGSTSTLYNVYAYYPTPAGTTATIVSTKTANVSVVSGQTTTGVNFLW
ncbi:MAG TPA: hypothetical protein DCS63_07265 [Elusimicrobia bacterium]|nr:hypothetical protein [Elusimicrobiota bacterium]